MDRLKRTVSFNNNKKENLSIKNENKPLQWQDDQKSVRIGRCSFNVKVNILKILYKIIKLF